MKTTTTITGKCNFQKREIIKRSNRTKRRYKRKPKSPIWNIEHTSLRQKYLLHPFDFQRTMKLNSHKENVDWEKRQPAKWENFNLMKNICMFLICSNGWLHASTND